MRGTEYKYQAGEVVNETLKIESQIRLKTNKRKKNGEYYTVKGYVVKSLTYPTAPPYKVREGSIQLGKGCAYTTGKRIFDGNSLWSIKRIRPFIMDTEQAKSIAPQSHTKINVKCPLCKKKKIMEAHDLVNREFSCTVCRTGISYPELFFNAYNQVLNLNFKPQQTFDDLKGYIFDYVNYDNYIVVETHGRQHYNKKDSWYKKAHKSDMVKRKYCRDNGWTFIELDCRKSDFNFIKNSINNNNILPNVSNEEEILDIILQNKYYDIKKIIKMYSEDKFTISQIGTRLGISYSTVRDILKRTDLKMRKIGDYKSKKRKKIRCITTGGVFNSITEASEYLGLGAKGVSSISRVCMGKQKSAWKHPITGEKLRWEYVDNE